MFLFFCCCFCFLIFIPRSTFDRSVHSSRFKKIDNVHFLLDKFIREYISLARYSAHLIEIEPYKIYKYRLKINTPLFSKSWITAQFFGIRVVFDVDYNKCQKKLIDYTPWYLRPKSDQLFKKSAVTFNFYDSLGSL